MRRWPLMLALLLLSARSDARPDSQPVDLLRQAIDRHAAADFQGAVELLRRASSTVASPATLAQVHFHLGINHEVLGDPALAGQAFSAALTHDPTLQIDPRRFRSSAVILFRTVRAGLSGRIEVRAPADVKVTIDGAAVGSGKIVHRVPIGAHRIRLLSGNGNQLLARSVIVAPNAVVLLESTSPPTPKASKPAVAPVSAPAAHANDQPKPAEGRRRIWTWVTLSAAVASAAVATGFGVSARADHDEWEDLWQAGLQQERWNALAASGKRKELAANILFGTAGILAITSAVLFFLEGRPENPRRSGAAVTLGLPLRGAARAPGVGVASLAVSF